MPVFYGVDPSDVRKQNGKYGEAFTKHECDNKHKIESWRKALVKVGNLARWVPKDFAGGHEAICIKDIVTTISRKLFLLITDVDKNLTGIDSRLQDLKSQLKIGAGGVRMVGIWGVGGGGKTTLASVAYMELSHQFEACCLLENIREESRKHGLTKLQANILSLVLKNDVTVWSEIEGKSKIKKLLCHKRVLVVLDDVNDRKQLEALAGSKDWFGEGSRIIITTRDKHLLTRQADMIYEVSLLSHDEAIKLFSKYAYRKDKPLEGYEKLSQDAISYAGGLPLALVILGSFLCDKDKDEWESALAYVKHIPNVEVMEKLKISYDGLNHDEQKLFLDIACSMKRSEIEGAMTVLDAGSFHPRVGVRVLVEKSLLKALEGRLYMHDLVVKMAHYILSSSSSSSSSSFSFGLLVLETVTGQKTSGHSRQDNEMLHDYVKRKWFEGTLSDIFDPRIDVDSVLMRKYIEIGLLCVQKDPTVTPTMKEVVDMLLGTLSLTLLVSKMRARMNPEPIDLNGNDSKGSDAGEVEEFISELDPR